MMEKYIDAPYEKKMNLSVKEHLNFQGKNYCFFEETPGFFGSDHVVGDRFIIEGKEEIPQKIEQNYYFEIEDSTKPSLQVEINWEHRLDIMQQNLGNALLRHYIAANTNLKILSYSVDETRSYVEVSGKDIAFKTVEELESLTNYALTANLLVRNKGDAITIDGLGTIEYQGPCLRRTGEVAFLSIPFINRSENGIYLNILCGNRALKDYREKTRTLRNMMSYLNSNTLEDLFKDLKKLKSHQENLQRDNKKMEQELGLESVREYKKLATTVEDIHYIYKILPNVNFKDLKFISSHIMDESNYVQIYGIPNGQRAQVLVVRSKNLTFNLKDIFDEVQNLFPLEGSGNMYIVQGNCDLKNLSAIMERFLLEIKKYIRTK